MKNEIYILSQIRLAKNRDLLIAPGLLKIGQPYYVLDKLSKSVSGVYILDAFTSSIKLEQYFKAGKIYVPTIPFNEDIINNLQQSDLKVFRYQQEIKENTK